MTAADIEARAAEWLIRLEEDRSLALSKAFDRWIAADGRHRAAYVRLEATWTRLNGLSRLRPIDGQIDELVLDRSVHGVDWADGADSANRVKRAVGTARRVAVSPSGHDRRARSHSRRAFRWIGSALAVLVVAGAIWVTAARSSWQVYRTEFGGFERIALQDGSVALLNTNTEIRVRVTSRLREVVLARGEALFAVAHDRRRPFEVYAAGTSVRATGTSFAVRLRDHRVVDVIVADGRVFTSTSTSAVPTTLSAGDAARIDARWLQVHRITTEDLVRRLSWTQGWLSFNRETLAEAVSEFNRYNRRKLAIHDPAIAALPIGGAFQATDVDTFVAALRPFGIRAPLRRVDSDESAGEIIGLVGEQPMRGSIPQSR